MATDQLISVIIPTHSEKGTIGPCIERLWKRAGSTALELIVSDGGSSDGTLEEAKQAGADRVLSAPFAGRAAQMNHGASYAKGELFYFLHADATPPPLFDRDIRNAVSLGYQAGTFRFRFVPMRPWMLRLNSFMTRFSWAFVQGGDRSLFIERQLFGSIGGYDEERAIMEDFEILERIRPKTPFRIVPKAVEVSSRKYRKNGYFRVQYANWKAMRLYRQGADTKRILREYKKILHSDTPGY